MESCRCCAQKAWEHPAADTVAVRDSSAIQKTGSRENGMQKHTGMLVVKNGDEQGLTLRDRRQEGRLEGE
jgi:hypothetical protein